MSNLPFRSSNEPKFIKMKTSILMIIVTAVVFGAGGAVTGYLIKPDAAGDNSVAQQGASVDYAKASEQIKSTNGDTSKIVEEYSSQYEASLKEVQASSPASWDKAMIDKAYFTLLYADKTGAKSQVEAVYYQIFAAQRSGVDVDSNTLGINQQVREEILARNLGTPQDGGE